jgi:hypothetical protein
MLRVGDRITNDILEKNFKHATCFFVNETRDSLDPPTTSETTNGGLGNALDVVSKDLAVALGTSLSKPFSSFSTACTKIDES